MTFDVARAIQNDEQHQENVLKRILLFDTTIREQIIGTEWRQSSLSSGPSTE